MAVKEIVIRGAAEHNLKHVDLTLPRNKLVVLTGVSGSGKSSLVFETLHAEAQRRYLEAAASKGRKPWRRPHVDLVEGLPPSVAVGQRARRPGVSQRLVDALGLGSLLRVLHARAGVQHCPQCDRSIEVTTHDEAVAAVLGRGGLSLIHI